jgi:hypothetical protein
LFISFCLVFTRRSWQNCISYFQIFSGIPVLHLSEIWEFLHQDQYSNLDFIPALTDPTMPPDCKYGLIISGTNVLAESLYIENIINEISKKHCLFDF